MKQLSVDVSQCITVDEFYSVFLRALRAPEWHGRNLNALWDSITSDINDVMPPYVVVVSGSGALPGNLSGELERFQELFAEARQARDLDISLIVSRAD